MFVAKAAPDSRHPRCEMKSQHQKKWKTRVTHCVTKGIVVINWALKNFLVASNMD